MPSYERCVSLIYQADGSLEEKLECAQMGLWGNIPPANFKPYEPAYAPDPGTLQVFYDEPATPAEGEIMNCGGGCGCGEAGGGGGSSQAGGGGGSSQAGGSVALGLPGFGSFQVSVSALLLAAIIGVMIARKG